MESKLARRDVLVPLKLRCAARNSGRLRQLVSQPFSKLPGHFGFVLAFPSLMPP